MYRCNNCNCRFDKPDTIKTTYEDMYGVSHLFSNGHSVEIDVCPCCGEDDFDKYYEEESYEED